MFSYEEVLEESVRYFEGDELAGKVFADKYALRDNDGNLLEKTPTDLHWRLAKEFARIEKNKFKEPLSEETIFNLFDHYKYISCQGGPCFGIGNDFQTVSLSNCYVVDSPVDSYGGILKADQELIQISKRRGGVGIDLSNLRPRGAPTKNAARNSTGIVSWMERFSNSIREVGQDGRRGALMLTLDIDHPDALDFISVKNDPAKVTGANISVKIRDLFMEILNRKYIIANREQIKNLSKWDKVIESAWNRAEPGVLFWDRILNWNLIDCYEEFQTISTNPCSELPLCAYDSCRLMFLNLFSYVINPFTKDSYFNQDLFEEHVRIAQRLMDDLIDLEIEKIDKIIAKIKSDPEKDEIKQAELNLWIRIKDKCDRGRRTGLGVTAVGDMLASLDIKYGSDESVIFCDNLFKELKHASFRSSVEMAKELGPFPAWDWKKEKDREFLLQIKEESLTLYNDIKKYGRRNIGNLTIAPVGTLSILTQTTSGIEPCYKLSYIRRKKINHSDNVKADFTDPSGDRWLEFEVSHPKLKLWKEVTGETDITKSPYWGCTAEEINWTNRVKMQAAAQKHIDHAISSTINLPENISKEEVANIYMTAWKSGCKGMTIYRNNCRTGVLVDKKEEPKPAKRPKRLKCHAYYVSVKGQKYFVCLGLNGGDHPYEIFAGTLPELDKQPDEGFIQRVKAGSYSFISDNEIIIQDLCQYCSDEEEALARMTSIALRSHVDFNLIIEQLDKTKGVIHGFAKVMSRILKKYLPDSVKTDQLCPECKKELIRSQGCLSCTCGWSKC